MIDKIIDTVLEYYDIKKEDLFSKKTNYEILHARRILRKGAGAKQKYGEPTVLLSPFRCPISKVDEMKELIKTKLTEYLK